MNKLGPKEVVCVSVFQFMIFYLSAGGLKLFHEESLLFPHIEGWAVIFPGNLSLTAN